MTQRLAFKAVSSVSQFNVVSLVGGVKSRLDTDRVNHTLEEKGEPKFEPWSLCLLA